MHMTMRWFGAKYDSVTLEQIRQVPGVSGVITTLYNKLPGEVWSLDEITALKNEVEAAGLRIAGIESVNIHDAIKTGARERERYIDTYITTLENLGKADIHLVCYNFMAVFDWTRTELARVRSDGSTTMAYNQKMVDEINPNDMRLSIEKQSRGFVIAGWEPERLAHLEELFAMYKDITEEKLFNNLMYFLQKIMPICDRYDINMAIHPDDPAWPVFGLPRIIRNKDTLERLMKAVRNPHNGVTLCTGSLGSNPDNDIPAIIHALKGRIHFAHIRNLRYNTFEKGADGSRRVVDFEEAAHVSRDGSLDMYAIVKALHDTGFDGVIRPDHGRAVWGEVCMPGYGLYDRAMGACYVQGLWEAVVRNKKLGMRN